jgi:hypothetical protein
LAAPPEVRCRSTQRRLERGIVDGCRQRLVVQHVVAVAVRLRQLLDARAPVGEVVVVTFQTLQLSTYFDATPTWSLNLFADCESRCAFDGLRSCRMTEIRRGTRLLR